MLAKTRRNLRKLASVIMIFLIITLSLLSLCSCYKFEDYCKTTEDGFEYYFREREIDSEGGTETEGPFIIGIPDVEELTIPEYLEGHKVVTLGYINVGLAYRDDYCIEGKNTKKLTIQHEFKIPYDSSIDYVNFPNLINLTFIDFLYCNISTSQEEITVPYYIGDSDNRLSSKPTVELRKSDREFDLKDFKPKVILIPEYVEIIDEGVFAGLKDVTIKTSYKSKPEGWQDGWNGDCIVEWGVEIDEY